MSKLNFDSVKSAEKAIRAVKQKDRQKILNLLAEKDMNVSELQNETKLQQVQTSLHLNILRNVGLVDSSRTGRFVSYKINKEKLAELLATFERITTI